MAKKPSKKQEIESTTSPGEATEVQSAEVRWMEVRNLGCIGASPVKLDFDNIVVLVGGNNMGKSTLLRAYELIMAEGTKEGHIHLDDFPNQQAPGDDDEQYPEVILETAVVPQPGTVGSKYLKITGEGSYLLRERWQWKQPDQPPERLGFVWESRTYDGKPSGFAAKANARRPMPFRLSPFKNPAELEKQILDLFMEDLVKKLKSRKGQPGEEFANLTKELVGARTRVLDSVRTDMDTISEELTLSLAEVFPEHRVAIRDNAESTFDITTLFKEALPSLRIGTEVMSDLGRQGSGAQRAVMWAALRVLASRAKTTAGGERPKLLIIDEPELCLHPTAIRAASKSLYDLSETGGWQVMVATHSPLFIDLGRRHTTINRLERGENGVESTSVFRSENDTFQVSDRDNMKLLNVFDPYVGEFFFGGKTVVVEGDTEYAVMRRVIAEDPALSQVHVVRARGKSILKLLIRILNQFKATYGVLHDADSPKRVDGHKNGMWTENINLAEECGKGRAARLVASISNFEQAMFGQDVHADKPAEALHRLDDTGLKKVNTLVRCLVGMEDLSNLPEGFVAWSDESTLLAAVEKTKAA